MHDTDSFLNSTLHIWTRFQSHYSNMLKSHRRKKLATQSFFFLMLISSKLFTCTCYVFLFHLNRICIILYFIIQLHYPEINLSAYFIINIILFFWYKRKTFDENFLRNTSWLMPHTTCSWDYCIKKTCSAVARKIEDESPEEIFSLFNFPDVLKEVSFRPMCLISIIV